MTSTILTHVTQIFLIKLYHTETLGLHVYTIEDTEYIILHFLGSQEHFCVLSLGSCKQNIWVLTWFELQLEFVVEPLSLKIVNKDGRINTFCLHTFVIIKKNDTNFPKQDIFFELHNYLVLKEGHL